MTREARRRWGAWALLGLGGAHVLWGAVAGMGGDGDWVVLLVGALAIATGVLVPRYGCAAVLHGAAAAAVVVTGWTGLGHAPWNAGPAPKWFLPHGWTMYRSTTLVACLLTWGALGWTAARAATAGWRAGQSFLIAALAVGRTWPLAHREGIDFFLGDEGTVLFAGLDLLRGGRLYVDRFEFLWPGGFWLTALLFWLAGGALTVVHVSLTILVATCVMVMHACVRREAGDGWALVAVLLGLTALSPEAAWWSPHWMSTTTGLLATWLVTRKPPPLRLRDAGCAGLCVGATALFQQHKGAAVAAALIGGYAVLALGAVIRRGRGQAGAYAKGWGALVGGCAVAVVGTVSWFAVRGRLSAFWYATWTWLREGYHPANVVSVDWLPLDTSLPLPTLLAGLWREGSFTIAHLAPIGLALAVVELARAPGPGRARDRWWLLVCGSAGIFAATLLRFQYYRLVYVAPATCLLFAATLGRWLSAPSRLRAWPGRFAILALVASMAAHAWSAQLADMDRRPGLALAESAVGPVAFKSFHMRRIDDTAAALRFLGRLPPTARFFAYPVGGGYYVLTGRRNPTRYTILIPGYNPPAQIAEAIAALEVRRVEYVLWDRFYSQDWVRRVLPALPADTFERNPVVEYIAAAYQPVLELPTLTIYERRPAPPAGAAER